MVCPDRRTVLMGDEMRPTAVRSCSSPTGWLTCPGTLYVAKWTQTSGTGPGAGTLRWIELGHATSAEIEAMADSLTARHHGREDPPIRAMRLHQASRSNGKSNFDSAVPEWKKAAYFSDPLRHAGQRVMTGFTWKETTDALDKVAYVAMSYIYKTTDGPTESGPGPGGPAPCMR